MSVRFPAVDIFACSFILLRAPGFNIKLDGAMPLGNNLP